MEFEFLRGRRVLIDLEGEFYRVVHGRGAEGRIARSQKRHEEIRCDLRVDGNAVREFHGGVR